MSTNLKPEEVATWMREQARRFTEMAEQIESTFSLNGRPAVPTPRYDMATEKKKIRDLLSDGKARRVGTICEKLRIPEVITSRIVSHNPNIFERNERGWITLTEGGETP